MSIGELCPCCKRGRLYAGQERKLLQFSGGAPVNVERFRKETLRCNSCIKEFVASGKIVKWTDSARSSIVLQKCSGVPFYRLARMQELYNIAISESTLWQQCLGLWNEVGKHIYYGLLEAAGRCGQFYVDDTRARVLAIISSNKKRLISGKEKEKSCYSTVLCTTTDKGHQIILYLTKQGYCGENIGPVLKGSNKKIMSDASMMNLPKCDEAATMTRFNCLAHGLNKFIDIASYYQEECKYFIEQIRAIYRIDKQTSFMSAEERLRHHQQYSLIHIDKIYEKIEHLFSHKLVEPNSHLGRAMKYWQKNRQGLTKFLHSPGMELDNNRSERALKKIILQRKNSLFFKSLESSEILSGLTSIIAGCEANKVSSYDYLNWLQSNAREAASRPEEYLPWKYLDYLNNTERIAA